MVARDGRVLYQLREICGQAAHEVAVASNEHTVVFTAWNGPVENWLLYACDGSGQPRLLGEETGYHGQPSFSEDGTWVYFVHHPRKGGPPGLHEEGANAQLYRVRLDGSGLEALSDSPGCKLAPHIARNLVVYVHATCSGLRSIELLNLQKDNRITTIENSNSHYPDLSADGRSLLVTRQVLDGVQLVSIDLQKMTSQVLWRLPEGYVETLAGWGKDSSTIIYQRDGAVWRISLRPAVREEKVCVIGGGS